MIRACTVTLHLKTNGTEWRFSKNVRYFQVKYYRDTYAEHPEDRENIEYGVRLHDDQSLVTLTGMYDQMRDLGYDLRYARYGYT